MSACHQAFVKKNRFSVVRDFCGHGIGRTFHAAPNVLHFGRPGEGPVLRPGMFFTVEPMVNAGRPEVKILDDGWTAVTRDRSFSAQYEHMVGVTETGVEIFTLRRRAAPERTAGVTPGAFNRVDHPYVAIAPAPSAGGGAHAQEIRTGRAMPPLVDDRPGRGGTAGHAGHRARMRESC